jgi:hypothetical protein
MLVFCTRLSAVESCFSYLYYVNEYLRHSSVYVLKIRVVIVIVFFPRGMDMYVCNRKDGEELFRSVYVIL